MLIFARRLVSIIVLACGLCAPTFGDTPSAQGVDALRAKADQGNPMAELMLGAMYYEGEGGSRDYAEAARWWRKAADQANEKALATLGQTSRPTP